MSTSGVATQHPEYTAILPTYKRCRDTFKGTQQLWAETTDYLPKLTEEGNAEYTARLKRTVLYNAVYRTVAGMTGMLFRVPPVLEAPDNTEAMMDDVTMTGIPLTVLAQEIAEECLVVGRVGLHVNYPVTSGAMTSAAAAAMNLRPSLVVIKAEQIINWRCRRINNKYQLSLVVIEETHYEPVSQFEDNAVTKYRVLDMDENNVYRVRVILQDDKNNDIELERYYPEMGGKRMNFIPLTIIGPDNLDPAIDTPMLVDLVDANLAHYSNFSLLANGCNWSGIPTMVVTGHEIKEGSTLTVGAGKALVLPNPAAKVYMMEVGTAGFPALDSMLNRLEQHMVTLGSRMLESHKVQAESAQTALIYRSGEQSILSALSISISTGITIALKTFAQWAGDSPETVRFALNKEFFSTPVDAPMLKELVASWQGGGISAESKFEYLRRSEFYPPHATFEEEQAKIEADKPKPVKPPALVTTIKRNSDGSMTASRDAEMAA